MQCPVDGETLLLSERSGVEIDYCPKCRGVWLDRGELDKILDRMASDADRLIAPVTDDRTDRYPPGGQGYPRKKRKSMLSELFDFD